MLESTKKKLYPKGELKDMIDRLYNPERREEIVRENNRKKRVEDKKEDLGL